MTGKASRAISAAELDRSMDRRSWQGPERGSGGAAAIVTRWCGIAALIALAGTVVVFAALHLLPPTSGISAVTRTISEYALTSSAWAFNLGVLLLVAASIAVFTGSVLTGRIHAVGAGTVFGALWVAGLLTLVSFPKHNWALGPASTTGQVHRLASLVAFLALPIAVIVDARRRGRATDPASARWAFWLGVLSLVWFSPLLIAVLTAPLTGTPWWQAIPLGLVERGLALTEVLALAALAVLCLHPGRAMNSARADAVRSATPTPAR